jgi:hypothetical protein
MPLTATTGCLLTHLFAVTVFLNQDPRMKILLLLKANEVIVFCMGTAQAGSGQSFLSYAQSAMKLIREMT